MWRVKKLDLFIVRQFGLLFCGTFFICLFVLMMQFLWRYVDELIGKGLSVDVLAQFFWYMGLMLIPQALPLAILLSSLIAYGNLGESSELTAIKAAGISLMHSMRSLIVVVVAIACVSFYFQDVIGPGANKNFAQLLMSMKQKSPELEIPEGIFYDGIPGSNIYVEKKDLETGKLYGVMIYRQSGSYEDQAIILADSGLMQTTAEKKHLLLTLWNGEWFENMRSQDVGGAAEVPYRRETFWHKNILLDFDGDFNMADASGISGNAKAKSLSQIYNDIDSIRQTADSIGREFYTEAKRTTYALPHLARPDSLRARTQAAKTNIDELWQKASSERRLMAARDAARDARMVSEEMYMKADYTSYLSRQVRMHHLEGQGKFSLALSCIIFFFIGAPLGAIIRKGGLGVPVIISVLVFIVYYIFDNTGMRMAREGSIPVWFGRWISTFVLAPLAVFFTYKANRDSTVFNIDAYRQLFMHMFGLRQKRYIARKEVIIEDPHYAEDITALERITADIEHYAHTHKLLRWPNPIDVFFHAGDDQRIEEINQEMEAVIDDLQNARDRHVIGLLNRYPLMATHAHTRPFRRRWLNAVTGLVLPVGLFFYIRMLRFRWRLYQDLRHIKQNNGDLISRINAITNP